MKKKQTKFKPLQELYEYDHGDADADADSDGDTLLNPNSKAVVLSEVSPEGPTADQASGYELSLERKVKNQRQLSSSEASDIHSSSCQSSYSEDIQSLDSFKASALKPMLQYVTTSRTTAEHEDQDVFDCHGDENSCISKDDGAFMLSSDHLGAADKKNVTSSAVSVSSSCADVLDKYVDGQSNRRNGSPDDHITAEVGDQNSSRAHRNSSELTLPILVSDGLGPSETSFMDEQDDLVHKIGDRTGAKRPKTEVGSSDEKPSAILNRLEGNEHLKSSSPTTSTQEPCHQSQNVMHGNGSDDLVDVRVCDLCGDVGREAMLALCSMCSDGAEHIYCMTPKMDKVPEINWLCEDCKLMREPKRQRQSVLEISNNASKASCLKVPVQGSPTMKSAVQHVGKTIKHLSKASCSSVKKHDPATDVGPETKKGIVYRSVLPLKIPGSGVKRHLTQFSSLKNRDEGKDAARQVSSFVDLPAKKVVKQACSSGHRSQKPEQQHCGGSLYNSKTVDSSNSNLALRGSQVIRQRRQSVEDNSDCKLKKDHPDKGVLKSLSVTGSDPLNVSIAHSSVSTIKGVRDSTEIYNSAENKSCELDLPFAGSSCVNISCPRNEMASQDVKARHSSRKNVEGKLAIQVNGSTNVEALGSLAHEGENCVKSFAESVEERKSYQSSYLMNFPTKSVNAYADQGVILSTHKAEFGEAVKDENDPSVAYFKIRPFDFQHVKVTSKHDPADIDHIAPSVISAVPESRCIWKGTFKLEKSGKLPTECNGVQAHLSTCASSKVVELAHKFPSELLLKEVPRSNTWPFHFQKNHPTEQDIALYFFAQDLQSYGRSYRMLVEGMRFNDLALEASFGGFQLLVFPSSLLPGRSQCWNSLPFVWGVFRVRKVNDSYLPDLNFAAVNQGLYSPVTCGPESKFISAPVTGSAFASCTSHSSMKGTNFVDFVGLKSSASINSGYQSVEHEGPLQENHIGMLKQHHVQADTITFTHRWDKEDVGRGLHNDDLQKEKRFTDEENTGSINKTDIIQCGKSTREQTTAIGFCSNESFKDSSFKRVANPTAEFWQVHDVGSGSLFSLDSGPSESSDGRGCAKSVDEPQVELLMDPAKSNALNLDLWLGNKSSSEGIDLDLVLGFPSKSKYQAKGFLKDESVGDESVSLVLSLGMPCSNS